MRSHPCPCLARRAHIQIPSSIPSHPHPTPTPTAQAFVAAYSTAYGTPPVNAFAALGYDAARLAIDARTRAGSDDPKAIAAALAATTDFHGVTGTINYANGPVPKKDVWMVSVTNGTLQLAR